MQTKKSLIIGLLFLFTASNYSKQPKRPLRVLFWQNTFPAKTGGSSFNLIVEFIKAGHKVTIFAQRSDYMLVEGTSSELEKYDILSKLFIKVLPKEKTEFDIIFCQSSPRALSFLPFKKKNNIKGKLIVFVRGSDFRIFQNKENCRKIFEAFDLIAPVCDFFKRKLVKLHPNSNKVQVFHSSIDCEKFGYRGLLLPKNNNLSIISTCSLVPRKGLANAIEAIALLVKKYPHLKYYIIGGGRQSKTLRELIRGHNLTNNVFILGWKSSTEVVELLKKGHIFILPSVTRGSGQEGIPNAVKEAMAIGLPVVSTYHAGIPELIQDGVTGFLVPERNAVALAEKIDFLIQHPEIWEDMVSAARKTIETHFERTVETKKLMDACYKLIE